MNDASADTSVGPMRSDGIQSCPAPQRPSSLTQGYLHYSTMFHFSSSEVLPLLAVLHLFDVALMNMAGVT